MAATDSAIDRVLARGKLWRVDAINDAGHEVTAFLFSQKGAQRKRNELRRRGYWSDFYLEPIDATGEEINLLIWDEWPTLPTEQLVEMVRASLAEEFSA